MENGKIQGKTYASGKRMANLELLRCVAMMMVVVLHYLGKGNLLADLSGEAPLGAAGVTAWLLESFSIVAVNVYMLISGYFLCMSSFKISRLVQLWLQVFTYSAAFGLAGAFAGIMEETAFDTHYLLTLLFPVSMGHYWFMTAYIFLYLLLPFVGMAAGKMTRGQMRIALGLLLFMFCILKSILPVRLETDGQGYDCLWYLCVFLAAAYIRRFGVPFLEKRTRCLALYAGCCLSVFGGTMALRLFYLRTGSLERLLKVLMEYNHILPFLAAVGLFGFFLGLRVKGRAAGVVNRIAPYTLGVYLLHENLGLRYTWQKWLGSGRGLLLQAPGGGGFTAAAGLVLWTMAAAACVFVCGIMVDAARKRLFGMVHCALSKLGLYRRLVMALERADQAFGAFGKD